MTVPVAAPTESAAWRLIAELDLERSDRTYEALERYRRSLFKQWTKDAAIWAGLPEAMRTLAAAMETVEGDL